MRLLHGDYESASRKRLTEIINIAKQNNAQILRFEGKNLDINQLIQSLSSPGFFASSKLIIIENLFSLPPSANKSKLLESLSQTTNDDVVIWESKIITPAQTKQFPKIIIETFKTPPQIFNLVEQIKPNNTSPITLYEKFSQSGESDEFLFAMIVRQIRLLISFKNNPTGIRLPPWQKNKLKNQSDSFALPQLLRLHNQLYQIDKSLKTGRNPLDLSNHLLKLFLSLLVY